MNRINALLVKNYTTVLLIIGFVLSCFVAVNVMSLLNSIQSMQKSNSKSKYNNECDIDVVAGETAKVLDDKKFENFLTDVKCNKGNLCLYGYFSIIGDGMNNPCTFISLSENESVPMNIVWGRMPSKKEIRNKKNVIMVGTLLESYIKKQNNKKFIYLDDVKYEVTGIFKSDYQIGRRRIMDLFTYYNCIDSKAKKNAKSYTDFVLTFRYGSSVNSKAVAKNNVNKIKSIAEKYGYPEIKLDYSNNDNSNKLLNAKIKLNEYLLYVTFGFTLINCMVISNVWSKKRYNEFVIRRTFGYSIIDMVRLLFKDLAGYGVIAMVLGIAIQTIYAGIFGREHLKSEYMVKNILYLCILLILVLIVTVVVPILHIRKILPATEIRKQKK